MVEGELKGGMAFLHSKSVAREMLLVLSILGQIMVAHSNQVRESDWVWIEGSYLYVF